MSDGQAKGPSQLTDAQKECLRLVKDGFQSKEIAHKLGIGIDAVNKRLEAAKVKLGTLNRFEAARQLAAYEQNTAYHSTVGQILAVEPRSFEGDLEGATDPDRIRDDQPFYPSVGESQAAYDGGPIAPARVDWTHIVDPLWALATPHRVFAFAAGLGALIHILMRS